MFRCEQRRQSFFETLCFGDQLFTRGDLQLGHARHPRLNQFPHRPLLLGGQRQPVAQPNQVDVDNAAAGCFGARTSRVDYGNLRGWGGATIDQPDAIDDYPGTGAAEEHRDDKGREPPA